MKWHTQRCHDSSKALLKDQGVGGGPNPRNLHPFPKIARIILPLISVWITQPIKTNHTKFCHHICPLQCPSLCGVCFSLYLNKFTSYLSLCLSLNSFCHETSRTWASLSPETRYCGFWLGSCPSHVGLSPKLGFGWVWVPIWGKQFHRDQETSCDRWSLTHLAEHHRLLVRLSSLWKMRECWSSEILPLTWNR